MGEEREIELRRAARKLAPHIIRVGRTFVHCVTAPNRSENEDGEVAFSNALCDLIVAAGESDL